MLNFPCYVYISHTNAETLSVHYSNLTSSSKGQSDSSVYAYRKTPKFSDTRKMYCNNPKIRLIWIFSLRNAS